jgi:DNA-binding NarL/FixJ family response regulator
MIRKIIVKNRKNSKSDFETNFILTEHALEAVNSGHEHAANLKSLIDHLISFSKTPHNVQVEIVYRISKDLKNNLKKNYKISDRIIPGFSIESKWRRTYDSLTGQEKEILNFILRNFKQRQICEKLNIKLNTEKSYRKSIYRKIGISDLSSLSDWERETLLHFANKK